MTRMNPAILLSSVRRQCRYPPEVECSFDHSRSSFCDFLMHETYFRCAGHRKGVMEKTENQLG